MVPAVTDLATGQIWEWPSLSQPGQSHRLIIGDCREPAVVSRLLDGRAVQGIFTSPLYARQRQRRHGGVDPDAYVEWWDAVQANARDALDSDGSFFVNIKAHVSKGERSLYVHDLVLAMARRWHWRYIDELCWLRQAFPGSFPNRFKNGFEPIFHFALTARPKFRPENVLKRDTNLAYAQPYANGRNASMGATYNGHTGRNVKSATLEGALPSNVIRALTGAHERGVQHGASFPVGLPEFVIKAFSDAGDVWLDLFAGGGTLAEAAELTGRIAYLVEIKPEEAVKSFRRLGRIGLRPQLVPV